MPALSNLSFETEGAAPGFADGWTHKIRSRSWRLLGFGPTPTVAAIQAPNDLSAASWFAVNATVATNVATDPDGGSTADRLTEDGTNASHYIEASWGGVGEDLVSGQRYGLAAFLKKEASNYAGLALLEGANASYAIFDLGPARVPTLVKPGNISKISASITDVGNGWFLCEIFVKAATDITGVKPAVLLSSDGVAISYAGAGRTMLVWGVAFFDVPREAFEAYERGWANDSYLTALVVPTSASPATFQTSFVDPNGFENFESAWANYPFLTILSSAASASFDEDGTPETVEDFEELWNNAGFATTLSGQVAASFDQDVGAENFEDFEDGWLTSPFITVLTAPTLAQWNGDLAETRDGFETVQRDKIFTADATTDTLTSAAHGLTVFNRGFVLRPTGAGTSIPGGLNETIVYWVVTVAANTFQLSLTSGGAAVNFTDNGVGQQVFGGDPARFWIEEDYNATLE